MTLENVLILYTYTERFYYYIAMNYTLLYNLLGNALKYGCIVPLIVPLHMRHIGMVIMVRHVRHRKGTGKRSCNKCGSWIAHWEHLSGNTRAKCSVYGCSNAATDGAHVCISRSTSKKEKIVPTCSECNPPGCTDEFRIVKWTKLVPAVKCKCKSWGRRQ
jgi:hypothetical protein